MTATVEPSSAAERPRWSDRQDEQCHLVESTLTAAGFHRADAYRYNPSSIRVRVIDPRFEGLERAERDDLVDPVLATLPPETEGDIVTLLTLTPEEATDPQRGGFRLYYRAKEFEDAGPPLD